MMMHAVAILALSLAPALVQAHGIVTQITVQGGETFTSPKIGRGGKTGPFYLVADDAPVNDPSSPDTSCGRVSTPASSTPKIPSGSTLEYKWGGGYFDGAWVHNSGPMITYVAKCSSKDCSKEANAGGAKFFKIQQDGFEGGGWKQAQLHDGRSVSVKLPNLEPGVYLVRHEVINLANTPELFPSCSRWEITGNGNVKLSGDSARFPGAYSSSDRGLSVAGADLWTVKKNSDYRFPGPAVFSGSSSGPSTPVVEDEEPEPQPSSTKAAPPTQTSPVNNGSSPSNDAPETPSNGDAPKDEASQTAAEPAAAPAATEPAPEAPSAPAVGGDCATAWTECNAKYMDGVVAAHNASAGITKRAAYTCQEEFNSCVAASARKARRMHRMRRSLHPSL